jgi:TetR/AcrR family transcriptional regulator, ethionamide resistance regulator
MFRMMARVEAKPITIQAKTGQRRRAATQLDLLEATKRLLEDGASIRELTIEQICREAGVVRTTFYLHFNEKNDLVKALATEQVGWIEEAGRKTASDPEMTRETVRGSVDEIVARWAENQAVLAAVIELAEHDPELRDDWQAAIREIGLVAAGIFEEHWKLHPDWAPQDPETVAELLSWMIERSCHKVARDPGRRDEVAASIAEIIWRVLHPQTSD